MSTKFAKLIKIVNDRIKIVALCEMHGAFLMPKIGQAHKKLKSMLKDW